MNNNLKLISQFLNREEILPLFQYFLEIKNVDSKKAESIINSFKQVEPELIVEFMGVDIDLIDVDYSPGCDAKINCPVENSYPAESPEISYTINTGSESFNQFLEENHESEIQDLAFEKMEESLIAAHEDHGDYMYDQMKDERMYG